MPLINYNGSQFLFDRPTFKRECVIDYDFKPCMDFVNESAKKRGIQIYTVSSKRNYGAAVAGAVVKPATRGNHFVAQAVDFKLLFKGQIYGHNDLDKDNLHALPHEIKDFLLEIDAHPVLRWGGLFRQEDDIHIDSGLNITDPKLYDKKFREFQNGQEPPKS